MSAKQARKQASAPRKEERRSPRSSPPSGSLRPGSAGTDDPTFNLVSVLYHAMQGADTAARYLRDAQNADQAELASFFEETRTVYEEQVANAKTLLFSMMGKAAKSV